MNKLFYLTLVTLGVVAAHAKGERPNVILIVTDDQGYGDMSCHGNPWLKTPNLDRLYTESVRLEDYHVDPVCTPTRAALMTGRYSSRVGAWARDRRSAIAETGRSDDGQCVFRFRLSHGHVWQMATSVIHGPTRLGFRGFQDVVRHLAGGIDEIGNPFGNDYFDDTYYRKWCTRTN